MPTNPNDPINPITVAEGEPEQNGYTKREDIAKAAMQGILAEGSIVGHSAVAQAAVACADALILELTTTN